MVNVYGIKTCIVKRSSMWRKIINFTWIEKQGFTNIKDVSK